MDKRLEQVSRHMSKLLRHDSEGLVMDNEGWIQCSDLCKHTNITLTELRDIVASNDKKRFAFDQHEQRIRASQGHSKGMNIDVPMTVITEVEEDFKIYHGTSMSIAQKIVGTSILPGERVYVHWTRNIKLASKRAMQRDYYNPALVVLNIKQYLADGNTLYVSENEVYHTLEVDGKYLEVEYFSPNL